MRTSKFSEEQVIGFLVQAEIGIPIKEIGLKHGGMDASEVKRLRELEMENSKLQRLLAEVRLDIHALKNVFGQHVTQGSSPPQVNSEAALSMVAHDQMSERHASALMG